MATPVIAQIGDNLLAAVRAVSAANGYNQTLMAGYATRSGQTPADLTAVVYYGDAKTEKDAPVMSTQWVQEFAVLCYVLQGDSGGSAYLRVQQVRADMEKAVLEDTSRGGLAVDTMPGECEMLHDARGVASGIIVGFDVRYRTAFGNPYQPF